MSTVKTQQQSKELQQQQREMQGALEAMSEQHSLDTLRERFDRMSTKVEAFYEIQDAMKMEIKDMNANKKKEWKEIFKSHRQEYMDMVTKLKDIKQRIDRESLLQSDDKKLGKSDNMDDDMSNENMIEQGRSLMGSNKQTLEQTLETVRGARELGDMSIDMLLEQQQQIEHVRDDLTTVDSTLNVSKSVMRNQARRIVTDKYIWTAIFLLLCCVIVAFFVEFLT